jgi:zinc protease
MFKDMLPMCAPAALVLSLCTLAGAQSLQSEVMTLDNGMTVVLHRDAALPVVSVNLWYKVGAANEPEGRSGFAHLFEHLMFMGTARVPGSDFDNLMEAGGGSNNASTSLDRTNYFSTGPAELLPTLLWLDADRLEALGATMTQEKLDRQRDVVRNEIRQNVENTPYGRAYEAMYRLMYPKDHPYHNAVYGTHEDLQAATVLDVQDFFASFYTPTNATLVVAGDFDPEPTKGLIKDLFGTLPRASAPVLPKVPAELIPTLDRPAVLNMLDKVQLRKVMYVYHAPGLYRTGDAEANIAAMILGDGQAGRLYERLVVRDQTCVEVSAGVAGARLGSLLIIEAMVKPDADLSSVEKAIDEELFRLSESGPTDAEVRQRAMSIEVGMLSSLQSIAARADKINEYLMAFGKADALKDDLDRSRNATPAGVTKAARAMFGTASEPRHRATIRVLPAEAATPGAGDSPRDVKPESLPSTLAKSEGTGFTVPAPTEMTLSNGVRVKYWERAGAGLASATLVVSDGGPMDAPKFSGRTSLLADMLNEGTARLSAAEFSQQMQALGASARAGGDLTSLSVSVSGIERNFGRALELWGEVIRTPRLQQDEFERVKAIAIEGIRQSLDEPAVIAARVGMRNLYGDPSAYAWPASGTVHTVNALTLETIGSHARGTLRPDRAVVLMAGGMSADQARTMLEAAIGGWSADGPAMTKEQETERAAIEANMEPAQRVGGGPRVLVVNRPDAVQTTIRVYSPGAAFGDASRVERRLANIILGGSFTSRLNQNLREKNGFTYGAGSRFVMDARTGYFTASSDVQTPVTGAALREFVVELRRLAGERGDISEGELGKARQTYRAETIQRLETLEGVVSTAAALSEVNSAWETINADLREASAVTLAELNAMTGSMMGIDRALIVLVGDRERIMPQIESLKDVGLGKVEEVDVTGAPKRVW